MKFARQQTVVEKHLHVALQNETLAVRLLAWFRIRSFPFVSMLPFLPPKGNVIDFGCGFGLFAYLAAFFFPKLRITAYDPSPAKTAVAKKLLAQTLNVQVTNLPSTAMQKKAEAVVILDVLYLLPEHKRKALLQRIYMLLRRGGTLIVAFVPRENSWRYYLAWWQEWVMVKLLSQTHTTGAIDFETLPWMKRTLASCGFVHMRVHTLPTPWPFFHKHLLIRATKNV